MLKQIVHHIRCRERSVDSAGHLRADFATDLCLLWRFSDVDMDHPRNQSETVLEEQAAYAT